MKVTVELSEEELREFMDFRNVKKVQFEQYDKALRDLHELAGAIWDAVDAEKRAITSPESLLRAVKLAAQFRLM